MLDDLDLPFNDDSGDDRRRSRRRRHADERYGPGPSSYDAYGQNTYGGQGSHGHETYGGQGGGYGGYGGHDTYGGQETYAGQGGGYGGQGGYGQNDYGQGPYPHDQYAQDQYAQGQYAQDRYGHDQYAQDTYAGQGGYGQTQYAQEPYGHDQYGHEQYGAPPRGGPPPRGRSRNEPAPSKKKKKKRGRSGLALTISVLLLVCLGGGIFFAYQKVADKFITPDYEGEGSGEVTVVIPQGANGFQMAQVLKAADVVKSEKAFTTAFEKDPNGKSIQPGTYKLRKQMSGDAAVKLLLDAKSRLGGAGLTIIEGWTSFKIFKFLAEKLKLPEADFKTAAQDPIKLGVPPEWFKRKDGKPESKSIEGFLFPDTYEFPKDVTAEGALKIMVKRFLDVTKSINFATQVDSRVSPYEALIIASLAQAEALHKEDLGKVARVAYNRLFLSSPDMGCKCFQFDVTVNYSRELRGLDPKPSSGLTERELTDPKDPYNRNANGFVPTPINSPSKAALEAAMSPPPGKWFFFVAVDKNGTTKFSENGRQFCTDTKEAVRNGVLSHDSC
jgi:UPF0755 protein